MKRNFFKRVWIAVFAAFICIGHAHSEDLQERGYGKFMRGDIQGAENDLQKALQDAEASGDPYGTWQALIALGWFYDERGAHTRALEFSNRSLDVAINGEKSLGPIKRLWYSLTYALSPQMDATYREGRSLSWIAWAYSSMGRYAAAKALYQRAIDLAAPGGSIKHVMIWGLSTQELGWLQYKMGEYAGGRTTVLKAYNLASAAKIDIGIAECGTILAEMELLSGDLRAAKNYADKAQVAARGSYSTPFNVGASQLIALRIHAAMAKADQSLNGSAQEAAIQLEKYSERHDLRKILAYAYVVHAGLLEQDQQEQRLTLLQKALVLLGNTESELSGLFSAAYGEDVAQNGGDDALARFYVERGVRMTEEMLREVDKAHILGALATIDINDGKLKASLEGMASSAQAAENAGQWPIAFSQSDKLSTELARAGYKRLALSWARRAYVNLNKLLSGETTDAAKRSYARIKSDLTSRMLQLELDVEPPRAGLS